MYRIENIDVDKRQVLLTKTIRNFNRSEVETVTLNEFDKVKFNFLPNTQDTFESEIVLLDIELYDEEGNPTGAFETRAFTRRVDKPEWIMNFEPNEYIIEVV